MGVLFQDELEQKPQSPVWKQSHVAAIDTPPDQRPALESFQVPPDMLYAGGDEFRNVLLQGLEHGLDSLPAEAKGQVEAFLNQFPKFRQQFESQAEEIKLPG